MRIRLAAAAAPLILAAGTLTLPLTSLTAAHAAVPGGTIAFVRDANIWLVRADGTGLHQVTRDGTADHPYVSPTMSDAGVLAAGKGTEILRLQQNGVVLNRIDPPAMLNSVGAPVDGPPVDVAISPDGTRIAYTMASYTCPIGVSCGARTVTGVTAATGLTGPEMTSYEREPSWVSNSRLMVHGGYGSQVKLQDQAGGSQHWFDDGDIFSSSTDLGDAALSRDGARLAAIRSYGPDTEMIWYAVTGDPRTGAIATLPDPTPRCSGAPGASPTDAQLHDPSWSPDGAAFAVGATEGIWVVTPAPTCEASGMSLIGPGSEPSWSPAAIDPPPLPTTTPPPTQPPPPPPSEGATGSFRLKAKPVLQGKARVGRRLTATAGTWSPKPAKVRYTWLRNGRVIKGATKKTYRVVRRDRGTRIAIKVTVRGPGLEAASAKSSARRVR
ncbi:hypothetical protein [Nocardioides sp. zg-1228]|uniref:hypothetical protein n=1 Tax=Nocardioides sp. zg-1228 TaxID=2763008 RepID=UPI00164271E9|nr:hypothetical protein [Nocardioides sp. zg-1228]MBC2931746.1 hypothetical protein [Nocardioides sp. zg-1228]QSF57329.1 hypothetical protein JX575_17540 [Nocardioides sp. zg-1228]